MQFLSWFNFVVKINKTLQVAEYHQNCKEYTYFEKDLIHLHFKNKVKCKLTFLLVFSEIVYLVPDGLQAIFQRDMANWNVPNMDDFWYKSSWLLLSVVFFCFT